MYLAVNALCIGGLALGIFVLDRHDGKSHSREPATLYLFVPIVGGLVAAALTVMVAASHRKGRWPQLNPALHPIHDLARVPIAAALRDTSNWIAMEGRVAPARLDAGIAAPLSGSRCLYYCVVVEEWWPQPNGSVFENGEWSEIHRQWKIQPFAVTDESGFLLVDPCEELQKLDPVEVHTDFCSALAVHESRAGLQGLSAVARAYVEATSAERVALPGAEKRIRVTEIAIREGDMVSVLGSVEQRVEQAIAFREEGGQRVLAMAGIPLVLPARLDDIRWLVAFHRRFMLALIVGVVLALGVVGFAVVELVERLRHPAM